jgi:hypothetical protein
MRTILSRVVSISMLASLIFSVVGCASNSLELKKASESNRQDVFQQKDSVNAISGKSVLKIDFPVKNFKARLIDTYIKHSDPPYTVTVNIDGQSVVLMNEPVLEDLPGDFKKNPEAGKGWKYNFKKELVLAPGKHQVTIAIPLSDLVMTKEITLSEGINVLQLSPVYHAPTARDSNYPRFNQGLSNVIMTLNKQNL